MKYISLECGVEMNFIEVVVRYRNGTVLEGTTQDFLTTKNHFYLYPADNPSGKPIEVPVKELEAVFLFRDSVLGICREEKKRWSIQVVPLV